MMQMMMLGHAVLSFEGDLLKYLTDRMIEAAF